MSRPTALILAPRLPWPLDDGGLIAIHQVLVSLAREYDTTLVSFAPPAVAARPLPEPLRAHVAGAVLVPHRPPHPAIALLRGAVGRWPYMLERYRSAAYDAAVRRLVRELRPHVAVANKLHMATYADALQGVPMVLRTHDVEHVWLERWAERLRNPLMRLYVRHQVRRMEAAERELYARCALILSIQEEEAETMRRLSPSTRVETLPMGMDFGRFRARAPEAPPIVLLVASWDYPPNAEGGRTFLERAWPRVRAAMPAARLRLAGKHLSPALADLGARAGAEVVGYVDDVTVEFARASLMVVPLWMGTGVRVKVVEGLAAGVPIASTTVGVEGLGLTAGEQVAVADDPEALGDVVVGLLRDPARTRALGEAGHACARERWALDAVAQRMLDWCREASVAAGAAGGGRSS